MRGSIWSVVAVGTAAAMAPAILDVQVSAGSTGDDILGLLTIFDPLLGVAFAIVAFGLLLTYFSNSGF